MVQYFKIAGQKVMVLESDKPSKQKMALTQDGKKIYFGDPSMPEYVGTKRGDNYCARSSGISDDNKLTANTLSRKILWKCKGKESMNSFKDATIKMINKEEYFDSI